MDKEKTEIWWIFFGIPIGLFLFLVAVVGGFGLLPAFVMTSHAETGSETGADDSDD